MDKIKFYNIILKVANVDKDKDKKTCFFYPSLSEVNWANTASSFY